MAIPSQICTLESLKPKGLKPNCSKLYEAFLLFKFLLFNSIHMNRKLRMGMVGGGKDAFIGAIHRYAAHMDGLIEVSCGALSIHRRRGESIRRNVIPSPRPHIPEL